MYYRKEMTEKARAVIAGEIDIPCPIGWHTLYESNVLCAYACTLLRLPDAGIDADAIGAEDIRIFQYGVEHNIETVTGIKCILMKQPASRMAVTMALAAPTCTAGLLGAATMRRNGAGPSEPVCCT